MDRVGGCNMCTMLALSAANLTNLPHPQVHEYTYGKEDRISVRMRYGNNGIALKVYLLSVCNINSACEV